MTTVTYSYFGNLLQLNPGGFCVAGDANCGRFTGGQINGGATYDTATHTWSNVTFSAYQGGSDLQIFGPVLGSITLDQFGNVIDWSGSGGVSAASFGVTFNSSSTGDFLQMWDCANTQCDQTEQSWSAAPGTWSPTFATAAPIDPVPLPSTLGLLLISLVAMGIWAKERSCRKHSSP